MNTHDIELPPLPEWSKMDNLAGLVPSEIRQCLNEHARAAVLLDRQRRGEPTAAEISDVIREITGCPDIKNGEDSLVVALGMLFHRGASPQPAEPVVNQQMTTAASDVLADTQRAIIEAAEQRGYTRAIAECAQDREDAQRLDWLDAQNARFRVGWHVGRAPAGNVRIDSVIVTGRSKLTSIREAIDAARAAREES